MKFLRYLLYLLLTLVLIILALLLWPKGSLEKQLTSWNVPATGIGMIEDGKIVECR